MMPVDDFGLAQPIEGLRQHIVIRIPHAARRRLYPRIKQMLGIAYRDILVSSIAMVYQTITPAHS